MFPMARLSSLTQRDPMTTAGLVLSGLWLVLVALFWLLAPSGDGAPGGLARLAVLAGTVLPLVLIWLAITMARALAALRAEAEDLRRRLAQLREVAAARGAPPRPAPEAEAAGDPVPLPRQPAPVIQPMPRPAPRPAGARAHPARVEEPVPVPVDPVTLIHALNFPNGPDDVEAIADLRMALQDPDHARVLRAAQDVVTLLAGQDLYMDDLPPHPAPASAWRHFAAGARGPEIASVGGIRDAHALEIAASLMERDEIFRDTAQHFLRHFDTMLSRNLAGLDDMQIEALAETRSARAFMLLGRIAGLFD